MMFKCIHKFTPAKIGDNVRVFLPDFDIGQAVPRNIIFAIVSIEDEQFYKLGNKYGTLLPRNTIHQKSVW